MLASHSTTVGLGKKSVLQPKVSDPSDHKARQACGAVEMPRIVEQLHRLQHNAERST